MVQPAKPAQVQESPNAGRQRNDDARGGDGLAVGVGGSSFAKRDLFGSFGGGLFGIGVDPLRHLRGRGVGIHVPGLDDLRGRGVGVVFGP